MNGFLLFCLRYFSSGRKKLQQEFFNVSWLNINLFIWKIPANLEFQIILLNTFLFIALNFFY